MRDPYGYLVEVGQHTEIALDWFNNRNEIWRAINSRTFEASPGA
jgi:hypothetical protein